MAPALSPSAQPFAPDMSTTPASTKPKLDYTSKSEAVGTIPEMVVLDATFVTRSPPDIPPDAAIVGLCTVPYERNSPDDLGWHIADFLAFKTLLSPSASPKHQRWLANCDVQDAVKKNPEGYTHGHSGRVVSAAAKCQPGYVTNGQVLEDPRNITIQPSAKKLMINFINAVTEMSKEANHSKVPLLIIICGLTTLEQDIYFGAKYEVCLSSEQLHEAVDSSATVSVVTPSLTSAGWQINPCFNRLPAGEVEAKPITFLAKQCGAVFAEPITEEFLGWNSPMIDQASVDPEIKTQESHPGPALLEAHQKLARDQFVNQIHSCLAGRMAKRHDDHSFCFDDEKDDWEDLIGLRRGKTLREYAQQWEQLDIVPKPAPKGLSFLGSAFGGSKKSQLNHIKHMIKESSPSLPGYYASTFGEAVTKEFAAFMRQQDPDELDCRAMFNALEHRTTTIVLGDLVRKYARLFPVLDERCRDFNKPKWDNMCSKNELTSAASTCGVIARNIPRVSIPPGRFRNDQTKHYTTLGQASLYLAASLVVRYGDDASQLDEAARRIVVLIHQIKDHQAKLLVDNANLRVKGKDWLDSIGITARKLSRAIPIVNPIDVSDKATSNATFDHGVKPSDEKLKPATTHVTMPEQESLRTTSNGTKPGYTPEKFDTSTRIPAATEKMQDEFEVEAEAPRITVETPGRKAIPEKTVGDVSKAQDWANGFDNVYHDQKPASPAAPASRFNQESSAVSAPTPKTASAVPAPTAAQPVDLKSTMDTRPSISGHTPQASTTAVASELHLPPHLRRSRPRTPPLQTPVQTEPEPKPEPESEPKPMLPFNQEDEPKDRPRPPWSTAPDQSDPITETARSRTPDPEPKPEPKPENKPENKPAPESEQVPATQGDNKLPPHLRNLNPLRVVQYR